VTELAKTETVTVNLTSEGGFAGDVGVTARLVDGADVALPNIMVTGPASVTLATDGTGTAAYQIVIPMDATGTALTGTLKIALSSSAGAMDLSSAVTVNNMYTIDYAAGTGGTVANHMNVGMDLTVRRGTILRFHNSDTADHIIHGGGGFPHENQAVGVGGLPGRNYDVATIGIAPGTTGTLGCHTHGDSTYSNYTVQ
jgi:hypothetical protein